MIGKSNKPQTGNFYIYDNVRLGKNIQIGSYCLLGVPCTNSSQKKISTVIGDSAFIRSHTVIYAGNRIGRNLITGHNVLIREENVIGDKVSIGSGSIIEHHIKIGNKVRIHSGVFIPEFSILEEGCWLGPRVVLTNALHPLCPKVKQCLRGPHIKQGAKIGANVTILPGIIIGRNALVGAGSVVIEDVPDNTVVVGNPGKIIKKIEDIICPYQLITSPYMMKKRKISL